MLPRRLILSLPALLLLPCAARAGAAIGTTRSLSGSARLLRAGQARALHLADPLLEGDEVATMAASTAGLELFSATQIALGPEAHFTIDRFAADLGGVVRVGGAMVFDRPDDLPKLDLTVQSAFAQIGVRGTRFFAGPSKGVYGIFVARGAVEVQAGGETRRLGPGEGVDIAAPGAAPGPVAQWKAPRIAAAFASVGLTP
ncbi:MAG: FecR domain-containing protein [Gemmobacter sp.]|uniref:FecR domain-containing protein n=1 Tax=Gemmobacter sp. TaxID=1898957 RepID=UPI001A497071|nr:FecR domain-containing protein [Gemmobacter sp.]MBL8562731.1 FecR domain-containing protein [Gemmobacter sp.]